MSTMTYKGYTAHVEYNNKESTLVGRVEGIRGIDSFHSNSVAGLKKAMKETVDAYLKACEKSKKKPQKTYSGKFMLRVDPSLHAQIVTRAKSQNKSINVYIVDALERAVKSK